MAVYPYVNPTVSNEIAELRCKGIWLMGGESTLQLQLIRDLGLDTELRGSKAVILGVSAGSMNLGRTVAYIWDDPYFYEALGLTNITIKSHYTSQILIVLSSDAETILFPS